METALSGEDQLLEDLLARLREARFGEDLRCPRCGARAVQRWGSFSCRQRYRCLGCRRTFSDLTGTPAAYSKRLPLWEPYSRSLAEGLSVRRAAQRVGIHPATAFRWRHALLDELRRQDVDRLIDWIELDSLWFRYSEKGRRVTRRAQPPTVACQTPAGTAPACARPWELLGANVLVASDRRGHVVTTLVNVSTRPRINRQELDAVLARRAEAGTIKVLCADPLRFAPATFWPRPGQPRCVMATGRAGAMVRAYRCRFMEWMRRFRGVATRYLRNYLIWHRRVFRAGLEAVAAAVLRWPVGAAFANSPP
jgi:transposase-like protein